MKKNLKKTFAKATALAMAVAMMVSVVPANSADAKAKKPKLAKSVKVTVKKTKKVKIKNTKKIKKTKWSIKSKKIATISKKKKTSVKVKGKKVGKTTLTAKVTLKGKKKPLKLKMKVNVVKAVKVTPTPKKSSKPVTPTPKPTDKTTTKPVNPTPAPTPDKIGNIEVDTKSTLNIPVTELNETSITCNAKRTDKGQDATSVGAEYTKKGLKFTTKDTYNSGAMFYLDPITSEDDLEDAPTGDSGSNQGERVAVVPKEGKGGKVDIADYDYIRVTLFDSPYETNLRLYDDLDQFLVDGNGFPGTCYAFYGKDSEGRGNYVGKEPIAPGETSTANHYYADAAKTKDAGDGYIILPVSEAVKAAKGSEFIGIAVCGQFKNQEYGISKIELLKVKDSKPANKPASVVVSAEEDKTAILNGATLQLSAKVLNKNDTEMEDTVTWSVAGDAATIDEETGLLTADATKTGKVTVTAASKLDPTVKGTYEVEVCDETALMSIAFQNKYTTYTIDELSDGLDIAPKGLNGAGEPVAEQPEITVAASDASDGISYADGTLTATKAGSIKLTATSGKMKDEVTIRVVDGKRIVLTEDNSGWVENYSSGAANADGAKATVANGVLTYESSNWNGGAWVKVETGDKTVANIAGLLWTYQCDNSSNNDNKPTVSVRYADLTKPNQTGTGQGNADSILFEDKEYTAEDYAKGVDIESTFDWNFCYDNAGADVEIDTTGTTAVFTLGKNGPANKVQNFSNVIVLWGDAQEMPALKSVTVSEGMNKTEVPANRTLQLVATATYQNDKTKTVTKTATWESSNEEVATVDANGKVTPVAEGTVNITAKVGDVTSAAYAITVVEDEVVDPVTLTSTEEITSGNGSLKFADCTGYATVATTFDVTKFAKVTYKVKAYNASGLITSADDMDNTKVCVNVSSPQSDPMYNYGYGDGFGKNIVKEGTLDTDTGEFTLTCSTLSEGSKVADCLSFQLDGGKVTKIVITEIKFE